MGKKARIVRGKVLARDWDGTIKEEELLLRAGAKGTGKVLHTVQYWPWSSKSEEAAYTILYEIAQQLGYEIVSGFEE